MHKKSANAQKKCKCTKKVQMHKKTANAQKNCKCIKKLHFQKMHKKTAFSRNANKKIQFITQKYIQILLIYNKKNMGNEYSKKIIVIRKH